MMVSHVINLYSSATLHFLSFPQSCSNLPLPFPHPSTPLLSPVSFPPPSADLNLLHPEDPCKPHPAPSPHPNLSIEGSQGHIIPNVPYTPIIHHDQSKDSISSMVHKMSRTQIITMALHTSLHHTATNAKMSEFTCPGALFCHSDCTKFR